MKKLIKLIAIVLALIFCFALVGCEPTPSDPPPSDPPSGSPSGTPPTYTKAELATLYKTVAKSAYSTLGVDEPVLNSPAPVSLSITTDTPEVTDTDDIQTLKLVMASFVPVINMLGEYYENPDFVVSDKPVTFNIVNATGTPYTNTKISLLAKLDQTNNKIYLDFYMTATAFDADYIEYDYCEIGYDFAGTNGVTYFQLLSKRKMAFISDEFEYVEERLDEDGKCYQTQTQASSTLISTIDGLYNTFITAKQSEIQLTTGNFDNEFAKYIASVMELSMRMQ